MRQAANLAPAKAALQQRLVQISGQADDPVQVVDTLPLPVCVRTRARRDRCFKPLADYGHCAAKKLDYYGFKLGLRLSRCGMITAFSLLPARPHDVHLLGDLVDGFSGMVAADRGFIDAFRHAMLWQRYGIQMVTPVRKNMAPSALPRPLLRVCARWRKRVETVGSHLTERFSVARIRVHDLWHFEHRLVRKVLAHTALVFLNMQLGRQPLDLDGLAAA